MPTSSNTEQISALFYDIAEAIRAKGVSGTFYPTQFAQKILELGGSEETITPKQTLVGVFQDIAYALRQVGVTSNTISPTSMTELVNEISVSRPETVVKYLDGTTAVFNIVGVLGTGSTAPWASTDITNLENVVQIRIGTNVTSINRSAFDGCSNLTKVTIPDTVTQLGMYSFRNTGLTSVDIPEGIATIPANCFYGCASLASIKLPSTITAINTYAFYNCKSLTSIQIPSGVSNITSNCFYGCSKLEIIDFRSHTSVTTLANINAFANTSSNKEIIVPDSLYDTWKAASNWSSTSYNIVYSIVNASCSSLQSENFVMKVLTTSSHKKTGIYSAERDDTTKPIIIDWGDGTVEEVNGDVSQKAHAYTSVDRFYVSIKNIKSFAASASNSTWHSTTSKNRYTLTGITMTDAISSIGDYGFYYCYTLSNIIIPNTVTSIGVSAFYRDYNLKSITIPDSVTNIGNRAFENCSQLQSITIPDGVTSIGSYTFYMCSGLKHATIPDTVTSIGSYAFCACSGLTSVTIPDSVTSIGSYVFSQCGGLTSVIVGNNVTSIGNYAFDRCSGLTSIIIPSSVTSIGQRAFTNCSGLVSVTIPNSVRSIDTYTFGCCTGLTSVTIGNAVSRIDTQAFYKCSSCTIFDFRKLTSVPTLANVNAFDETSSDKEIIVPDSLYDTWIAASNWSSTSNNIKTSIVKASQSSLGPL